MAKTPKTRPIVEGYLEKVNSKIFDGYQKQITEMVRGNFGVYALYKRNKLYYIGLATNFKRRIKHHLRDRHQGKWNLFSLYIIRKADHIKEIESLLLRIAYPTGNFIRGKLPRSKNLLPDLRRQVKREQQEQFEDIFPGHKVKSRKRKRSIKQVRAKESPLRGRFPGGKRLYARYKGKDYKAWLLQSGTIKYDGNLYASPSAAGKAVRKKATNGWVFWKYKDPSGNLKAIRDLRG